MRIILYPLKIRDNEIGGRMNYEIMRESKEDDTIMADTYLENRTKKPNTKAVGSSETPTSSIVTHPSTKCFLCEKIN